MKNLCLRNLKMNIPEGDAFVVKEAMKIEVVVESEDILKKFEVDEFWGWRNLKAVEIEIEIWS